MSIGHRTATAACGPRFSVAQSNTVLEVHPVDVPHAPLQGCLPRRTAHHGFFHPVCPSPPPPHPWSLTLSLDLAAAKPDPLEQQALAASKHCQTSSMQDASAGHKAWRRTTSAARSRDCRESKRAALDHGGGVPSAETLHVGLGSA